MRTPQRTTPNQIIIALIVALAVFTIGLIIITLGLRVWGNRSAAPAPPTATIDIGLLPLTPLPPVQTLAPTPTLAPSATAPSATLEASNTPTSTATPTPLPTETATLTPTSTLSPTPLPTPTPTPTIVLPPTPYSGPYRANDGDYTARRGDGIVIDGNLSDWGAIPTQPLPVVQLGSDLFTGPNDLAVNFSLAWDQTFLYIAAEVGDELHVQTGRGPNMYLGDDIEFWLDTDLAGDFTDPNRNGDDFQFGFSAGEYGVSPAEAVVWLPQPRDEWSDLIPVAAQLADLGYDLEAAIPWTILGIRPASGQTFGFAVTATDNDEPGSRAQQTVLVHSPTLIWGQPTTFSNLRLQ